MLLESCRVSATTGCMLRAVRVDRRRYPPCHHPISTTPPSSSSVFPTSHHLPHPPPPSWPDKFSSPTLSTALSASTPPHPARPPLATPEGPSMVDAKMMPQQPFPATGRATACLRCVDPACPGHGPAWQRWRGRWRDAECGRQVGDVAAGASPSRRVVMPN
jgi:hypothetical protein